MKFWTQYSRGMSKNEYWEVIVNDSGDEMIYYFRFSNSVQSCRWVKRNHNLKLVKTIMKLWKALYDIELTNPAFVSIVIGHPFAIIVAANLVHSNALAAFHHVVRTSVHAEELDSNLTNWYTCSVYDSFWYCCRSTVCECWSNCYLCYLRAKWTFGFSKSRAKV